MRMVTRVCNQKALTSFVFSAADVAPPIAFSFAEPACCFQIINQYMLHEHRSRKQKTADRVSPWSSPLLVRQFQLQMRVPGRPTIPNLNAGP
jgi:hypothetical protein